MCDKITAQEIEKFILFVLENDHGISSTKISPNHLIATDLRLDGDDAWELLKRLELRFEIDLEDVFEARFWPESSLFKNSNVVPISVRELSKIIGERTITF